MPPYYECVILCYAYQDPDTKEVAQSVGAGHRTEPNSWIIETECDGLELPINRVLCWMPFPASPTIEFYQRPVKAENSLDGDLTPIHYLALSTRAHRALIFNGINTLGRLILHTEEGLRLMPHLGKVTVEEVKLRLKGIGLKLKEAKGE